MGLRAINDDEDNDELNEDNIAVNDSDKNSYRVTELMHVCLLINNVLIFPI